MSAYVRDGYLIYSTLDSYDGYAYALNRMDMQSGTLINALVTHSIDYPQHVAPAYLPDSILVLTGDAVHKYDYTLELIEEIPLPEDVRTFIAASEYMPTFSSDGASFYMTNADHVPVVMDYKSGEIQAMDPIVLDDGFKPTRYSPFAETFENGVFALRAAGEDLFPYYWLLYDPDAGHVLNYQKIGPHPNGELAADEQGSAEFYKWIDTTTNTAYHDENSIGMWWPMCVTANGLIYKSNYESGFLEIADLSRQKVYALELGARSTPESVLVHDDMILCIVGKPDDEQRQMVAFQRR
jgi:hypothetical protein